MNGQTGSWARTVQARGTEQADDGHCSWPDAARVHRQSLPVDARL